MTTTTSTTSAAATTVAPAISKRPLTLTIGAVLLVLAALLALSSPFLPRGRGFIGAGNRPAGARQAGQTGQGGGGAGQDQGGAAIQGQGGGAGQSQGGFGQGTGGQGGGGGAGAGAGGGFGAAGRTGGNAALFRFMTPIRITEGVIGGLFTLFAAWGIWKRKKWGMVMALIASAVMLLSGAVTVFLPLLGRTVTRALGSMSLFITFITGGQWEAIVGMIIAVAVAVLVLLPASQKGYIVPPKVRRVM